MSRALFLILFSPLCLIADLFDQEMTPEEQKKTGITRLSSQEKAALQRWIQTRCTPKRGKKKKGAEVVLQEVLNHGQFIRLSDQSLWEIDPKDALIVQSWITPAPITVRPQLSNTYPYLLKNELTGSQVQAKKVSDESL